MFFHCLDILVNEKLGLFTQGDLLLIPHEIFARICT